ncbi:hypothetical protein H072_7168 [Dactylellina haptotyla CBS 200.50]|uniref:Uncharacterized protein n=1 Tax=Dactylellina haptotyla (strain CBS 200.50) TaxID=1284197 RepID=S8BIE1_DACHA|nr:hypothetical protein H072_7168 [Dactylellina haptotyla CBS 200.50]
MQDNSDISESRHLPVGAKAKATVRTHDTMQSTSYSDISPVTAFAAFGLFWTLLSIRVLMLWVSSSEFQPAPILPSDKPTGAELIALNLFQYQSVILACVMVIFFVIAPWYADPLPSRARHPSDSDKEDIWLDARLMLGAVFCMFTDSYLNAYDYVFAWNAHAMNFGSWAKFMPFAQQSASSRYGVGILWVIP